MNIKIITPLFFTILYTLGSVSAEELKQPISATKVVDLTHTLSEETPVWPGGKPFHMNRLVDYDQGYRLHSFELGENVGTHVDAPAHFFKNGESVSELSLSSLVVPAVVINVQEQVKKNPDYQLTVKDLQTWERKNGQVPKGSLVILNTGWHKKIQTPKNYINIDKNKVMHFPGYSKEVAGLLVSRGVVGIGIDTLSLDHGPSKDFATHAVMLKAGKFQIENMANLDALPTTGATVIVGVLPVSGGTQAQARVIALM